MLLLSPSSPASGVNSDSMKLVVNPGTLRLGHVQVLAVGFLALVEVLLKDPEAV